MIRPESLSYRPEKVTELRKLVARGEGQRLEFKRKAAFPDKIVRELIAFANTDGGLLLVGVDDDQSIPGVKFPEEESLVIQKELKRYCRPALIYEETVIPVSGKRFVLQWLITKSDTRPHYYVTDGVKTSFVRRGDQSIKASREMSEIMRRSKSPRGTRFTYGEAEQKIIHFLDTQSTISLRDFSKLTGLNQFLASRKIVRLVLANVLKITPTEKGDLYSRV